MVRLAACLLTTLFVLFVPAAQAQTKTFYRPDITAADIDAGSRRDWYGVYFQNTKIGYFTANRERTKDGIRESFLMSMKIASFGQKIEMTVSQILTFDAAAPYALLKGGYSEEVGRNKTDFTFARTGAGRLRSHADDRRQRPQADGQDRLHALRFDGVGGLDSSESGGRGRDDLARFRAEGAEARIAVVQGPVGEDDAGQRRRRQVPRSPREVDAGQPREPAPLRRPGSACSPARSARPSISGSNRRPRRRTPQYGKDLFVFGMAKVDRKLGERKNVKELVVDVEGPPELAAFIDGPRQKVQTIDKTTQRVEVGKRFGKDGEGDEGRDRGEHRRIEHASHPRSEGEGPRREGGRRCEDRRREGQEAREVRPQATSRRPTKARSRTSSTSWNARRGTASRTPSCSRTWPGRRDCRPAR